MGISTDCAKFLTYSLKRDVSFKNTLMLGRQQLFFDNPEKLPQQIYSKANLLPDFGGFAEAFFELLGAQLIDSMDYSDFEGASIIHDLNTPIPDSHKNKYSVVFDGGTLEHVFNFPMAIKNCMDMLKVGGHFIAITPTNNHCGHGFYQFSPELFFSLFNQKHGFATKLVALGVENPTNKVSEWFEVKNPYEIKRRVILSNCHPSSLIVLALKERDTSNIKLTPFQSDYEHIWTVYDSIRQDKQIDSEGKWKHYYRMWVPELVKGIIRKLVNRKLDQQKKVEGLGLTNPEFFIKLNFDSF